MPNEEVVEPSEELPEVVPIAEGEEDTTDWKAESVKWEGLARRNHRELTKLKATPKPEPVAPSNEKKGFDYGEKAYLRAEGVSAEDFDFAHELMRESGKKSIEDLLASRGFQLALKDRKDAREVQNAIPEGSKRSQQSARNTVEYWVAKGELPPADQYELRKAVVKAEREALKKGQSKFSPNPVV